jgi:hypothetical protein
MLAHLQAVSKELVICYGFSSIQICGCVQMVQGETSTAIFAGTGSVHERMAVAREFCQRQDHITLNNAGA